MNIKPRFDHLPWSIRERFLYEIDLHYDGYDTSKEDTIHSYSNGQVSNRNREIIDRYYESVSLETLTLYLKQEIISAEASLEYMKKFLDI